MFCFDNSLIHRATYPFEDERTIVSIILYPSLKKITLNNIRNSLYLPIKSYPKVPWKNPCNA